MSSADCKTHKLRDCMRTHKCGHTHIFIIIDSENNQHQQESFLAANSNKKTKGVACENEERRCEEASEWMDECMYVCMNVWTICMLYVLLCYCRCCCSHSHMPGPSPFLFLFFCLHSTAQKFFIFLRSSSRCCCCLYSYYYFCYGTPLTYFSSWSYT